MLSNMFWDPEVYYVTSLNENYNMSQKKKDLDSLLHPSPSFKQHKCTRREKIYKRIIKKEEREYVRER
jgi:hypothetical protein